MTVDELTTAARTWVGVPFLHQGRSRRGVDCAGFIIELARECALIPPTWRGPRRYGRFPGENLRALVAEFCTVEAVGPGRLLLMAWDDTQRPTHMAICTGPTLIHAYQAGGGVVEHGYVGRWLDYTRSAWRLPGVSYE